MHLIFRDGWTVSFATRAVQEHCWEQHSPYRDRSDESDDRMHRCSSFGVERRGLGSLATRPPGATRPCPRSGSPTIRRRRAHRRQLLRGGRGRSTCDPLADGLTNLRSTLYTNAVATHSGPSTLPRTASVLVTRARARSHGAGWGTATASHAGPAGTLSSTRRRSAIADLTIPGLASGGTNGSVIGIAVGRRSTSGNTMTGRISARGASAIPRPGS
jgi:hypothetical protein